MQQTTGPRYIHMGKTLCQTETQTRLGENVKWIHRWYCLLHLRTTCHTERQVLHYIALTSLDPLSDKTISFFLRIKHSHQRGIQFPIVSHFTFISHCTRDTLKCKIFITLRLHHSMSSENNNLLYSRINHRVHIRREMRLPNALHFTFISHATVKCNHCSVTALR